MNWMQYIKIKKKYVISSILTYILLQLIIFSTLLSKCINDLYEYNRASGKNELSNRIAMNLGDLMNDTILFKLFLVGVLILTILPAFFINTMLVKKVFIPYFGYQEKALDLKFIWHKYIQL